MNHWIVKTLACLSTAFVASALHAQVVWPQSPASLLAQQRLQAFNTGSEDALTRFQSAHEPQLDVQRELGLWQMTGGLDVLRVTASGPYQVSVLLRETDGDQVGQLDLTVNAKQPTQVSQVQIMPLAEVPSDLMPPRLTALQALQKLQHKAGVLQAKQQFAGNVLVAKSQHIQLQHSVGAARITPLQPHDASSRFRIGSMYKMFTAVGILQLMEQGKIQLDAPLLTYLPDYPNSPLAHSVTIRHLLTHTAGTGDIFTDDWPQLRLQLRTHQDYIRQFGPRAAEFAPGTQEAYANYGYVLLGAVIERVSGQTYADYLQTQLFQPAGMSQTGSASEQQVGASLTIGYTQTPEGLADNRDTLPWSGTAAGGGYSTVGDLHKFAIALLDGRLLKASTLQQATESQVPSGLYGLGFQRGGDANQRYFGHIGGAPGMNAALRIYPATGDIVIALSNMDPPAAEKLVEYYGNRMPL